MQYSKNSWTGNTRVITLYRSAAAFNQLFDGGVPGIERENLRTARSRTEYVKTRLVALDFVPGLCQHQLSGNGGGEVRSLRRRNLVRETFRYESNIGPDSVRRNHATASRGSVSDVWDRLSSPPVVTSSM